jgi:hypothetical protein
MKTRRCGPTAFLKDETILWTRAHVQGACCTIETFASATDQLVDRVTITKPRLQIAQQAPPRQPISADSAQAIAAAYMPGATLVSQQLEQEDGRLIYSYYLRAPKHWGVEEINIDAWSGAVLGVEHERAADPEARRIAPRPRRSAPAPAPATRGEHIPG